VHLVNRATGRGYKYCSGIRWTFQTNLAGYWRHRLSIDSRLVQHGRSKHELLRQNHTGTCQPVSALANKVKLPLGYRIIWAGEFEELQLAKERLEVMDPAHAPDADDRTLGLHRSPASRRFEWHWQSGTTAARNRRRRWPSDRADHVAGRGAGTSDDVPGQGG
jgi:hypothetical protein